MKTEKNQKEDIDIFILAAEDSADNLGYKLIKELLNLNPNLKILAVSGPRMKKLNIKTLLDMENFKVMGFTDVFFSLFKLIKNFFFIRKQILNINPKACVLIDYAEFNLKLEKSLRKKAYKNKLIHFISPTVWAWRKKRTDYMAKYLDILLTIFPFEKNYYSHTSLDVRFIGHPLANINENATKEKKEFIGIFPGSRPKEIKKNFPLQLEVAKKLLSEDPKIIFAISIVDYSIIKKIFDEFNFDEKNFIFFKSHENYDYFPKLKMALATSGTINLELALFKVPSVINYVIEKFDIFVARNIFKIRLPFYCIVNILMQEEVFKELYGPNLTIERLYEFATNLYNSEELQNKCIKKLEKLNKILSNKNASKNAANIVLSTI